MMGVVFAAFVLPFILLNAFGGIVSGIWLAVLGQWWAIGIGLAAIFAHFFLSPFMLIGMAFTAPAVALVQRGQNVLALPFLFLGLLFTYAVVAAWGIASFHIFMSRATHETYLPLLLWSYGVACGPWAALTEKERRSGGSNSGAIVSTSLCVGYLVTALVVVFGSAEPMTWLVVFLAIMGVGLAGHTVLAVATVHSPQAR